MSDGDRASAGTSPAGGVPLWAVGVGAAVLVLGFTVGPWLYHRSLAEALYTEERGVFAAVEPDRERLERLEAALREAQRTRGEVRVDAAGLQELLYHEVLDSPERAARIELAAPFVRIRLSERRASDGRYMNATLLTQLFASEEGLGFAVRAGQVGGVSISRTEGEWVRTRIERQLHHDLAANERTRELFRGLTSVRVTETEVELAFRAPAS